MKEPVNYNNKHHQAINNNNNSSNNNLNIPTSNHTSNRSTFREHIRAKNPYQELINSSNNNNNNNSNTNNNLTNNNNNNINNNNTNSTNQNLSPKYAIQQMNSSSKILDNQKYHKYFSKRKMMAQYELEMRNEKKNKLTLPTPPAAHQQREQPSDDQPVALYTKNHLPPPQTEPEELTVNETNNNSSATANNNTISSTNNSPDVQIKVEPDVLQRNSSGVIATVASKGVNDDDDDENDSSNSEKYFLADLRKRKHSASTIEQTLALTTKKEASTACS